MKHVVRLCAVVLVVGCGGGGTQELPDGGSTPTTDAGRATDDSGVTVGLDGGNTPPLDAGSTSPDAGVTVQVDGGAMSPIDGGTSRPAEDTCAGAIDITGQTSVNGSTLNATNTFSYSEAGNISLTCRRQKIGFENDAFVGLNGPDVVYSIRVPARTRTSIQVIADDEFDAALVVSSSCSQQTCITQANAGIKGQSEHVTFDNPTTSEKTFFVQVDSVGPSKGTFSLRPTSVAMGPAPANDECSGALVLAASGTQTVTGNTLDANDSSTFPIGVPNANCPDGLQGLSTTIGKDVVYQIEVPAHALLSVKQPIDKARALYLSSTCESSHSSCVKLSVGLAGLEYVNIGELPVTLFLFVDGDGPDAFSIDVSVTLPLPNDVCPGTEVTLTSGTARIEGTNIGSQNNYAFGNGLLACGTTSPANLCEEQPVGSGNFSCRTQHGGEVVYSVVVYAGETLTATVQADHFSTTYMDYSLIFSTSCGTREQIEMACVGANDLGAGGTPETLSWYNTSGTSRRVYIIVDSSSAGGEDTFVLNIESKLEPH